VEAATLTREPEVRAPAASTGAIAETRTWVAGQWWALVGVGFVLFWAYVLLRWVTGPYFHNVPGGPSQLPLYMKISTITWQAAAIPIVAFMLYRMGIRPWLRERIVATDGLLVVTFLVLALQDPVSSFFGHWYTYNAHMFNMGAFTNEIPGWASFGAPGAQQAYPILFMILAYPGAFFVGCWLGAWAMRKVRQFRPNVSVPTLVLTAIGINCLFDIVLEGFFWCPLGFYSMPGGHLSLFPGTYHKFPLTEVPCVGMLFGFPAALRYLKNEKGETLVERGITGLQISTARKTILRLLTLIAATQLIYLIVYQLPIAGYVAANPGAWPKDVQDRSYFTDHLCGPGTNRLCPGPGVPLTMAMHVNAAGQLVGPKAEQLRIVPYNPHPQGPYQGTVLGLTHK
jgi:Spirocyclase AveC-like